MEGETDVAGIAAQVGAPLGRHAAEDSAGLHRGEDQRAGFHRLQPGDGGQVEGGALRLEVHHLPARHAGRAGSAGEIEDELGADERIGVSRGIGEHLERQRVEAIAGEDRGRLVELLVHRRAAAAQVIIVHRRQVVMDQRIDVDCLQRGRDPARAVHVAIEQPRGGEDEQRAQSFAAVDGGVAHRAIQVRARVVGHRKQRVEARVDLARGIGQRRGKRGRERHPAVNGVVMARPSASSRIASIRACAASSRSAQRARSALPRS